MPALLALCKKLRGQQWCAIDTEFMRERTYYAKLCLLQIASPNTLACIDTLALDTIDPLLDVIYEPDKIKIFHSARQDLELFYDLRSSIPAPIYDTQIAAALIGHPYQIGYADLVQAVTGTVLEKGHTRTNWATRPLKTAQLHYAIDDVRYLHDLYQHLSNTLVKHNRMSWLEEECAALSSLALYQNNPAEAVCRIKRTGNLTPIEMYRLRVLAAWREQQAKDRDLPRNWVVRDPVLIDLAKINPSNLEALQAIPSMPAKTITRWGDLILETLGSVGPNDIVERPVRKPLSRKQAAQCKEFAQFIRHYAEKNNINVNVLASRNDIKALITGGDESPILHGWRQIAIGNELVRRLNQDPV